MPFRAKKYPFALQKSVVRMGIKKRIESVATLFVTLFLLLNFCTRTNHMRGGEVVTRGVHSPKIDGSIPSPATNHRKKGLRNA